MENEYTDHANDPTYFNKELSEKMDKNVSQNKVSNVLSIAILAVLVIGLLVTAVLLISMNENITALQTNVRTINQNVDMIYDDVSDMRDDVSDLVEQNCQQRNQNPTSVNPVYDPWEYECDKPVVYIYADQPELSVHAELTLMVSDLIADWPTAEQNGNVYSWDLTATPDGTLYDDENEYSYIFWEASGYAEHDFSEGFCVAGADTAEFLRESLSEIGLTPEEYNEFIVYWLPKMQGNAYNLITFEGLDKNDAYNRNFPLTVTDENGREAESVLRVMMAWKAVDAPVQIAPQTFETFERDGFTVVEWGGTEIR